MKTENIIKIEFERRFVLRCMNCLDKDYIDHYYRSSKGEILDCCVDKTMRVVDVIYKGK